MRVISTWFQLEADNVAWDLLKSSKLVQILGRVLRLVLQVRHQKTRSKGKQKEYLFDSVNYTLLSYEGSTPSSYQVKNKKQL